MELEFRHIFSERARCGKEQFEQELFWRCLFRHSVPLVWLLLRLRPQIFREDFDLMRELASARNTEEVVAELNRFYGRNAREKSFLRGDLRLRVSGKRVLRLYRSLVSDQPLTAA